MNKYEIMFIVRPDVDEETRKATVTALEKTLTENKATITLSKELGQKEFDRVARIDENVVRHLVLKIED